VSQNKYAVTFEVGFADSAGCPAFAGTLVTEVYANDSDMAIAVATRRLLSACGSRDLSIKDVVWKKAA